MNNYMKTIISGLKQWVSSQKSDWKQNDSSAPNYVKNRTHYEENKEIIIFPETTFVTEDWDGVYGFETTPTSYPLKAKQSYTIILDGNNYIVSALISPYDDEGFYLGNTMLLDGDDTKEPFGIMVSASQLAIIIITDTEPTEHTLEIKGQETVIHKLDKKYLPDDLIPEEVLVPGDNISNLYNDSVVSYTEDQSLKLTDDQKARARNNIGAGTSNFSGYYSDLWDVPGILLYDQYQYISNSHLTKVYQNLKLNNNFLRIEANTPTQILSEKQQENTRAKIGVKDSPAYNVVNSGGTILNRSQLIGRIFKEDTLTKTLEFYGTYTLPVLSMPTENNKYLISVNSLRRSTDPMRFESRVFQGTCKKLIDNVFYIGNLALRDANANNSGEEFLCLVQPDQCNFFLKTEKEESWSTNDIYLSVFDDSKIEYHALDKRYLPTDILTSELVNDSLLTYSEDQWLTEAQKAQARENIGAGTSNFSGSYNDLTDKPETPNIDETQIINDIYSFDELTNPNIGIIYRSNSGNEAGFLNVLDTIPIKEDSMPEILVFNAYDIKSGVITYYAESAGTETLTINFNDNTITGVDFNGIVSTNTLDNYSAETGYGNTIMIKVADIWSAHCRFDFYGSAYKAISSGINNVYEGVISQIATRAYVNNNDSNYATEEDVLYILNEIGAIKPITTSDGKILTDNNGAIYSL